MRRRWTSSLEVIDLGQTASDASTSTPFVAPPPTATTDLPTAEELAARRAAIQQYLDRSAPAPVVPAVQEPAPVPPPAVQEPAPVVQDPVPPPVVQEPAPVVQDPVPPPVVQDPVPPPAVPETDATFVPAWQETMATASSAVPVPPPVSEPVPAVQEPAPPPAAPPPAVQDPAVQDPAPPPAVPETDATFVPAWQETMATASSAVPVPPPVSEPAPAVQDPAPSPAAQVQEDAGAEDPAEPGPPIEPLVVPDVLEPEAPAPPPSASSRWWIWALVATGGFIVWRKLRSR